MDGEAGIRRINNTLRLCFLLAMLYFVPVQNANILQVSEILGFRSESVTSDQLVRSGV